jgi:hypothetical protein
MEDRTQLRKLNILIVLLTVALGLLALVPATAHATTPDLPGRSTGGNWHTVHSPHPHLRHAIFIRPIG